VIFSADYLPERLFGSRTLSEYDKQHARVVIGDLHIKPVRFDVSLIVNSSRLRLHGTRSCKVNRGPFIIIIGPLWIETPAVVLFSLTGLSGFEIIFKGNNFSNYQFWGL